MSLVASLLAPLAEEVAFRGYVLSALRTRLPARAAVVGSAVLFAAMHLDPVRFPAVLVLGLYLGWLAWRSGSIWPAVAAHAVNNGLGALVIAAGASDPEAGPTAGAAVTLLGLGLLALLPMALAWIRATPSPPSGSEAVVPRDPSDPSIAFRLGRVPPAWLAVAATGLVAHAALSALAIAKG